MQTEAGNSTYDYLTIKSQYSVDPLNAGDIFLYSQSNVTTPVHIGNYLSPLVAQLPAPKFGFGYSNLEKDENKTVDIQTGQLLMECVPVQKEFYL